MSIQSARAVTVNAYQTAGLQPVNRFATSLGPMEIEGRTRASLISAGTELAACFNGSHFPTVPGYAAVFEVEEVGEEVTAFRPGDLALCMGPHRSFQRDSESRALKVPSGLKPEEAVFARMMSVTMSTLTTTTARPPDKVLVMGLGLVGHLAAQTFARCGYMVHACDPSDHRRALAKAHGIANVSEEPPFDNMAWRDGVALALECSGHEGAALAACQMMKKRGEVVQVGTPWQKKTDLTAHELLHAVFHRYLVLRSGWEWEVPMDPTEFKTGSIRENLAAALRWLAEGSVRVEGLYESVSPERAQTAYEKLSTQQNERLAFVFNWDALT